ncbi:glycosyltransferase family 2 protein [Bacteroides faecis]|uniref:glycosyltransferase family 2 protein n=1 Tax=Bacteroides faecis TaxID=674529 RepID=UPI0022E57901|nr:glycosyltransferase family 2 protein [Bacteroides faecis]
MNTKSSIQIGVVMAVYNASETLKSAIESVRNQSYSNWIMVCVDDGSTDNSFDILQEYSLQDSRITVFGKENGGPASARAMAYEFITTPYTITLDSDDCFSPDLLQSLVSMVLQTNADAIAPNFLIEQADGSVMNWNEVYHYQVGQSMSGEEAFSRIFIQPSVHGVNLWKTELLKKYAVGNNAVYNKMNADEYIQRLLFLHSKQIVFSNGAYIYNYNPKSITKKLSIKHIGYLETCRKYIQLTKDYPLSSNIQSIIKEYYLRHIIHLQMRLYKDGKDLSELERIEMKDCLHQAYKEAMKYKKEIAFTEKKFPILYKSSVTNGYTLFCFTCYLLAGYKRFKEK